MGIEYYKKIEDDKGGNFQSSTNLTTAKQQAQDEIGKSRETINRYARMSDIDKTGKLLEQYEAKRTTIRIKQREGRSNLK